MKEFVIIIFIGLINIVAIILIKHRERKKREKIKEKAKKERAEIMKKAQEEIRRMKKETERFEYLMNLFKNWVILYNNNPKKFSAYEKEFSEWYEKIIVAQFECMESIVLEKNDDTSFQNLLMMLEQFAQWAKGKIE